MAQNSKFQIETDDTSEHMRLMRVARLFDRNYYNDEEIGEVINDGLKIAIKMVQEVNRIMTAERSCLKWIDGKLLHDLSVASSVISDVHIVAVIAQAEKEREMQATSNGNSNQERSDRSIDWTARISDDELRQTMQELYHRNSHADIQKSH